MTQGYNNGFPIDTDGTLTNNSDQLVASQKAVKTYAQPLITPGSTTQYYRGDKAMQTLNPTAITLTNTIGSPDIVDFGTEFDHSFSSGCTNGAVITNNGNGTINLSGSTVFLRQNNALTSLTSSGLTATATTTFPHGYNSGDLVSINGATQTPYNVTRANIIVTGLYTFTFTMLYTTTSPATGTPYSVDDGSTLFGCYVPAINNLALTNHATNYIYADYNFGSPTYAVTTSTSTVIGLSNVYIYTIAYEAPTLYVLDNRAQNVDGVQKITRFLSTYNTFNHVAGGTVLSASGTRNIAVTAGTFYSGSNQINHSSFDTSVSDTFTTAYQTSGVWTFTTGQTQISNTQYNNTSSGLASISTGQYGAFWVYMVNDTPSSLMVVYGTSSYVYKSDARASLPPTIPASITGVGALIGRIIILQGASAFLDCASVFNVPLPTSELTLNSLYDVTSTDTPNLNDVLTWNGSSWINGAATTTSAGAGVTFYNATPILIATGINNANLVGSLSKQPVTTTEQTNAASLVSNTLLMAAWLYNTALGRTLINAGAWNFNTYAGVSATNAGRVTTASRYVYQVTPESATVTTTGSGTSRTATASGSSFVSGDANASITASGYIQTPQGLYQITAYTSTTVVTIATPTGYTNESSVSFNKWINLFGATSSAITSISPTYSSNLFSTTQPSYVVAATDLIGIISFGTSNNTTTLTCAYNGTLHNTDVSTPLAVLHDDLAGLQGGSGSGVTGQYYHLTSTEYTGTGTGTFVRTSSPTLSSPTFTSPILGTPTSGTLTNCTGTASGLTAGSATTVTSSIGSTVTATTQAVTDTSTYVATDAFVNNQVRLSMAAMPLSSITGGTYSFASKGSGCTLSYTVTSGVITAVTAVVAGGTNYIVGDLILINSGNYDSIIKVVTLSGSAVATVAILYGGSGYANLSGVATSNAFASVFRISLTGTLTSNALFIIPNGTYYYQSNQWIVSNNTTGSYTVTFKISNGSDAATGTGVVIPQGTNSLHEVLIDTDGVNDVWLTAVQNAADLSGTTLASGVTSSSLTSVGTLASLTVTGALNAGTLNPTASTAPTNGINLVASNAVGLYAAGTLVASAQSNEFIVGSMYNSAGNPVDSASSIYPKLYVNASGSSAAATIRQFSNDAVGSTLWLNKNRASDASSGQTIVNSGDNLATINFSGSDGTVYQLGAQITSDSDGTPGSGSMPSRLRFLTSASGSGTPTERLRITSTGKIGIGCTLPFNTLSVSPPQYSTGTAYQTTTAVTGVGTTWTSAMIGSQLIYSNGVSSGTITAVGSTTSMTVTTSQTVASSGAPIAYIINYTGFQVSSTGSVGIGTTPASLLDIAPGTAISQSYWGTAGVGLNIRAATFNDSSSSGTVSTATYMYSVNAPTLTATSSSTYTGNYVTLYVAAPLAGTNATANIKYAIFSNGTIGTSNLIVGGSIQTTGTYAPPVGMYNPTTNTMGFTTNALDTLRLLPTASSVDYLTITGSATASIGQPVISVAGTDTNIGVTITPKAAASVTVTGTTGTCVGAPDGVALAYSTGAGHISVGTGDSLVFEQNGVATVTIGTDGGVTIGSPTGGDKGAGTVNATNLYINGAAVTASAATITVQDFVAGTGFTAGTSTTITLSSAPASSSSLTIYFDGVRQFSNTWSVASTTVTFTSAIPAGVANIEATWLSSSGINSFTGGTAGSPGFSVVGSTNTGLYSSTANTIGISANGTSALYVNASGQVGIGNSSPSNLLTIGAASGTTGSIALLGSTSGSIVIQPQAAAGTYNFNLPTTAGSSGNILVSGGGSSTAMTWNTTTGSGTVVALATSPSLTTPIISQPNTTLKVTAKTSGYSLLSTDSGGIFTNTGAVGSVTFTLPTAAAGLDYIIIVDTAQTVVLAADTGHTIRNGTSVCASSGNFTSPATVGAMIRVVALNTTEWYVLHITESWTVN